MEFNTIPLPKINLNIKMPKIDVPNPDNYKWHRKFAFMPIRIGDTYHWLCNVYRRREVYKTPYDFAYYWNYMPYNDLALIAQTALESSGEYKPRTYDEDEKTRKRARRRGSFLFAMGIISVLSLTIWATIWATVEAEKRATELSIKVDAATSMDELKPILKEMLRKK